MWNKFVVWLKSTGIKAAVDALDLAKPYLASEIKKADQAIGETPEAKADWIVEKVQAFLRAKFKLGE